jgi:hypothetical protein
MAAGYPASMRAELRGIWTSEWEQPRAFEPDDPSDFGLYVRAMVGEAGGIGEESFDILVCSPSWLESDQLTKGFRWGHGTLLMRRWDPDLLERAVCDLVAHAEGESWNVIGERLARFAQWEFSDYSG